MSNTLSTTHRKIHWCSVAVLVVFFLLAYILPLGSRPLIEPDEFRYGEIPREMIASGDWVVPRMNNIRYFEKPALGYQWTALCIKLFGENAFAVRLPSALSVGLAALMIYWLLRRRTDDPWLPGIACGIFMTFAFVFGIGTFAVLDSQLSMAITWCIGAYYMAWSSPDRRKYAGWLMAAGAAAGAAFLFKGFLAFAVPVVVIAPFLCWQKDWKKLFVDPWIPLVLAVVVAIPWSYLIWKAEPDFWRYFFIEEHFKRFTGSTYDRNPEPFWFFIPLLLVGILPSGFLIAAAWKGWTKRFLKNDLVRFSLCWAVMPFLLFSASSCKTGTYILPCFPPLAILLAMSLRSSWLGSREYCRKALLILCSLLGYLMVVAGIAGTVAFLVWRVFLADKFFWYDPQNFWPLGAFIFGVFYGWRILKLRAKKWYQQMAWVFLGCAGLMFLLNLSVEEEILYPGKMPEASVREVFRQLPLQEGDVLICNRRISTVAAWVLKRPEVVIFGSMGEYQYGFTTYPEEYKKLYFNSKTENEMRKIYAGKRMFYLALRDHTDDPYPKRWKICNMATARGVTLVELAQ